MSEWYCCPICFTMRENNCACDNPYCSEHGENKNNRVFSDEQLAIIKAMQEETDNE